MDSREKLKAVNKVALKKFTEIRTTLDEKLRDTLVKIPALREWLLDLEIGQELPYRSPVERTQTGNVAEKQKLEAKARKKAKKLAFENPGIANDTISVEVAREGYGSYLHSFAFKTPALEPGQVFFFWGHPEIYKKMLEEAKYKSGKSQTEKRKWNVLVFEDFVTHNLRATYVPENVKKISEKTHISYAKTRETLEEVAKLTGKEIIPEINWRNQAANAAIIEVSKKVIDKIKFGTWDINVTEHCIQLYDPVEGVGEFKEPEQVLKILEKYKIKAPEHQTQRTALALDAICKKLASDKKTAIILFRDETKDGKDALNVAKQMKSKEIFPLFDYKGVDHVKEAVQHRKNYWKTFSLKDRTIHELKRYYKPALMVYGTIAALGLAGLGSMYLSYEPPTTEPVTVQTAGGTKLQSHQTQGKRLKENTKVLINNAGKRLANKIAFSDKPTLEILTKPYDLKTYKIQVMFNAEDRYTSSKMIGELDKAELYVSWKELNKKTGQLEDKNKRVDSKPFYGMQKADSCVLKGDLPKPKEGTTGYSMVLTVYDTENKYAKETWRIPLKK